MDFIVIICTQISSYKYRSEWTSIKTSIVPIRSDLMWSQCKCFCVWKNPEVVLCAIFLPRVPYNWWTRYNWWKQSLFLSLWVVQTSDHWFPSAKSWNHASSSLFVAIPEWWHALHPLFFFFFFFFCAIDPKFEMDSSMRKQINEYEPRPPKRVRNDAPLDHGALKTIRSGKSHRSGTLVINDIPDFP